MIGRFSLHRDPPGNEYKQAIIVDKAADGEQIPKGIRYRISVTGGSVKVNYLNNENTARLIDNDNSSDFPYTGEFAIIVKYNGGNDPSGSYESYRLY